MITIPNPPPHQIKALGALAYVDAADRDRIMRMSLGFRKKAIEQLEREIERRRKQEYFYA